MLPTQHQPITFSPGFAGHVKIIYNQFNGANSSTSTTPPIHPPTTPPNGQGSSPPTNPSNVGGWNSGSSNSGSQAPPSAPLPPSSHQPHGGRKSRTTGAEKPHIVEKVTAKLSALQVSPTSSGESEKELPTSFTVPLMGRAMTYRHIPKI
jgi:hypothetical protein